MSNSQGVSTATAKSSSKTPVSSNKEQLHTANTSSAVSAPSTPSSECNIVPGLKQAHSDMLKWIAQSHGAAIDSNIAKIEANGVKREHAVYGILSVLVLYLLAGNYAQFVSNVLALAYPMYRTVQMFKTNSTAETGILSYFMLFGVFVLFDSLLHEFPAYFVLRTAVLVFGYLPQTRGSCLIYNRALKPFMILASGMLEKVKLA